MKALQRLHERAVVVTRESTYGHGPTFCGSILLKLPSWPRVSTTASTRPTRSTGARERGTPVGPPPPASAWGPDHYDVIQDGRDIGRIFKPRACAPPQPWECAITGAIVKPSHGFAATGDEAKAKFAETWALVVGAHSMTAG